MEGNTLTQEKKKVKNKSKLIFKGIFLKDKKRRAILELLKHQEIKKEGYVKQG